VYYMQCALEIIMYKHGRFKCVCVVCSDCLVCMFKSLGYCISHFLF
jgi:hypothetical protein